ncbi:MAG: ankyrin repeat domain-containing protein [Pyrinomonadaceae bacterium]
MNTAKNNSPKMSDETYEMIQQLFQLVRSSDAARLQGLFEKGFDAPNIRDGKGNTLLMLASYNGQLEMTRVLLEHGADSQIANDMGQIPLAGAAFKGNVEMAKLLIENGADVNAQMPDGKTPLMFAAMFNRLEIIDLFLEHGADVSLQSMDGSTAETMAQMMGAEAARSKLENYQRNE